MEGWRALAVLAVAVLASAVGVAYAKHEARKLFVELQQLYAVRDALDVEWGQLQLEQSTWATDARIERLAHQQLHMRRPPAEAVVVIKP